MRATSSAIWKVPAAASGGGSGGTSSATTGAGCSTLSDGTSSGNHSASCSTACSGSASARSPTSSAAGAASVWRRASATTGRPSTTLEKDTKLVAGGKRIVAL